MNDDFQVPYLSPPIWELMNRPQNYHRRKCDQCDGYGRFISYCWDDRGSVVSCPVCDATGWLYILIDQK